MPVPDSGQLVGELHTLLTRSVYVIDHTRRFLRISQADATRWLNGMVTNSIQALGPGEGNYNFLLNAQGRILGDATIYREPGDAQPSFLLETSREQVDAIRHLLDKFIIMDDVELSEEQEGNETLFLIGPELSKLAGQLRLPVLGPGRMALAPSAATSTSAGPVLVFTPSTGHVPVMGVRSSSAVLGSLREQLQAVAVEQGSAEALEQLRVLEARPRYGTDIRNSDGAKDLPQETAQAHALHFAKGCYVGQEIVERIRSRGQVHRLFTAFRLEGTPPADLPALLEAQGKPAGELTSVVSISTTTGPQWLALGYARREFLDGNATFTYPGGTARTRLPGHLS